MRIEKPEPGLFMANRSSLYSCTDKPCKEAFPAEYLIVDRRNVDDPKKLPYNRGTDGDWYDLGSNHRLEGGNICRDMGWERRWFVRLEDIMAFVDKYGQCVIGRNLGGFATIEIYDHYRE
jgi:hypothetical protein